MTVQLSDDQRQAFEVGHKWSSEALAELGRAHLVLKRAQENARRCEERARHAVQQQEQIFAVLATMLQLPEGRWTYDRVNGTLVGEPAQEFKEGDDA